MLSLSYYRYFTYAIDNVHVCKKNKLIHFINRIKRNYRIIATINVIM